MGKSTTRVVYKPDTQSTEEFVVIVNPEEYKKWKEGDRTIPLADVVDSFDIFHSTQGHQGILGKASDQQLDNCFGTHKDVDAVTVLLEKGSTHSGEGFDSNLGSTNLTRGSAIVDSRGKGLKGV